MQGNSPGAVEPNHVPSELPQDATLTALESVLLVAGGPVSFSALASAVDVPAASLPSLLAALQSRLAGGIRLQIHDDQAQLVTAPESAEAVHRFLGTARPPALSKAALETLAVVAYRQPVIRAEIESARGVNSDRALQTLLARGLVEERGHRASPGRPVEYGTGFAFLEYFGLTSLDDLPPAPQEPDTVAAPVELGLRS